MLDFTVSHEVRSLGVRVAGLLMAGLNNGPDNPGVEDLRSEITGRLKKELTAQSIESDRVLAGFRALHDKVGRSNRRFPAASEALINLFVKKGLIPKISPVVDIYNMVSLETRLSLGAHDTAKIHGNVELRLTIGNELFQPLGSTAPVPIGAGEYCYIDGSNEILCRLEHKQVEKTKVTKETCSCFFIIQGNAETSIEVLKQSTKRLTGLLCEHCGGMVEKEWIFSY